MLLAGFTAADLEQETNIYFRDILQTRVIVTDIELGIWAFEERLFVILPKYFGRSVVEFVPDVDGFVLSAPPARKRITTVMDSCTWFTICAR